jgi:hypothetical protein
MNLTACKLYRSLFHFRAYSYGENARTNSKSIAQGMNLCVCNISQNRAVENATEKLHIRTLKENNVRSLKENACRKY